jgi:hypothetical protein
MTGRAARALLPLAGFLVLAALLDLADWNEGPTRAAGLALFAAALALAWRRAPPAFAGPAAPLAAALAAALLRLAVEAPPLVRHGRPNDIGATTAAAVAARAQGRSPYATLVDPQRDLPRTGAGLDWFMGYKYGPLVPRWYGPFLAAFDYPRGLFAANAPLLAAAALLAAALARTAAGGGAAAALAAAAALLWPRFPRWELFALGVNDLLPTALALAALLAAARGRALLAGAALGLSLAAKPLPGALLLLLLPGTVRLAPLAAGLALGLSPYVPDLLTAPRELVANLLLFNLLRPGDSTGLAHALPPALAALPPLLGEAGALAAAVAYHRSRRTPRDLVLAAALVATLFLAGGKLIHRNYLLWWLPLAAAALGACGWRAPEPAPDRAPPTRTPPAADSARSAPGRA